MLITRWNEASRALPVSTLKSNYLDRWLNDCLFGGFTVNIFDWPLHIYIFFSFGYGLPGMTQLTRKSPIALRLILRGSLGPTTA